VQPPLDDNELTKYFIRAQEGIYFEKMMGMMGQKLPELVNMGDDLEEGIKSGKVQSMTALQATSKAIQSGSIGSGKKNKEEVSTVIPYYQTNPPHGSTSYSPNNHSPPPTYAPVYNTQPYYHPQPQYNLPRANNNQNL